MYNIDNKGRKYNLSTKGFKIDVYYNGVYMYSTDKCKTCAAAKSRFLCDNPGADKSLLKANFDKV